MKIKELINDLNALVKDNDQFDENTEIFFKITPNNGSEEDGDENDIDVNYVGAIYTGGDGFVELGFEEPNGQSYCFGYDNERYRK